MKPPLLLHTTEGCVSPPMIASSPPVLAVAGDSSVDDHAIPDKDNDVLPVIFMAGTEVARGRLVLLEVVFVPGVLALSMASRRVQHSVIQAHALQRFAASREGGRFQLT